jgi:hypothetical protein
LNPTPHAAAPLPRHAPLSSPLFRRARQAQAAEAARKLDERVFRHRTTGEIRVASWNPDTITFFNPKTRQVIHREHRKALQWCWNADDITREVEASAPLPPEIPATPVAEDAPEARS